LVRGTQHDVASMSATAGVRDELTVIDNVRRSRFMERLVNQESQLEVDALSDRKPVELPQRWSNMASATGAGAKMYDLNDL